MFMIMIVVLDFIHQTPVRPFRVHTFAVL